MPLFSSSALVAGESLLNDATSIIIVTLFLRLNSGEPFGTGELVDVSFTRLGGDI